MNEKLCINSAVMSRVRVFFLTSKKIFFSVYTVQTTCHYSNLNTFAYNSFSLHIVVVSSINLSPEIVVGKMLPLQKLEEQYYDTFNKAYLKSKQLVTEGVSLDEKSSNKGKNIYILICNF